METRWELLNKRRAFAALWILRLIWIFVASSVCGADAYRIDGVVEKSQRADVGMREVTTQFFIDLDSSRWIMHLVSASDNADYREVACDGTNTYHYEYLESSIDKMKADGKVVGVNNGTVITRPTVVPAFLSADASAIIWLSYASADYFHDLPANRAEVPSTLSTYSGMPLSFEKFISEPVYLIRTKELRVPKSVYYVDAGIRRFSGRRYPKPFDKGFTNIIFEITRTTNLDGITFPQQAQLREYFVSFDESNPNLVLEAKYILTTLKITRSNPMSDYRPKLKGVTVFSDEQFDKGGVGFDFSYITNTWLTKSQIKNLPAYATALRSPKRISPMTMVPQPKSPKFLVVLVLFWVSVPVLIYVLYRKRSDRPKRSVN